MPPHPHPTVRVSIIEPVGGHGGMNGYDFNLCEGLAAAGADVALFTSDATRPPARETFAFHPTYRGIFGREPKWIRAFRFVRGSLGALVTSCREGRRIVHFHFFSVGPLEAMNVLMARLLGRRVVITAHDVEAFVSNLDTPGLPRFVYNLADAVVAHNRVSREALLDRMALPARRVHVIPAGNHLGSLPPLPSQAAAREKLGLPSGVPVLLFFGQIKDVKGLDLLLEALPVILKNHPSAILLIAGRPWKTNFDKYQRIIDATGIQDVCRTHIRYIPDEEVPAYYQCCDLVTLPYRRIYQSDVVLMAMSMGKAVLTSDIPGMTELVEHNHTGLLFRSNDSQDLARVVNEALFHPEVLQTIAQQGNALMREQYDWHDIGEMMVATYRTLVT